MLLFRCYDNFGQAPKKKVFNSSEKMRHSLICQSEYTLRGHQPITGYRYGGRLAFKKGVAGKRSLRATCNQPSKRGTMSKGSRPEQAVLSRDTDMSKTEETRKVIEGMVDGLNDHRIADIGEFFTDGFRWMQRRLWHKKESEGVPGQLAETISGSSFVTHNLTFVFLPVGIIVPEILKSKVLYVKSQNLKNTNLCMVNDTIFLSGCFLGQGVH